MIGVYGKLLMLGLVVYVACMLISLGDAAPIDEGQGQGLRNRRAPQGENAGSRGGMIRHIFDGNQGKGAIIFTMMGGERGKF